MASAANNPNMHALLYSLNQLTQRVANMGQQLTGLQRQQQPAPTTITSNGTAWRAADIGFF
jgi:hypothetical protein